MPSQTFTASGTFTVPSNVIGGVLTASIYGCPGSGGDGAGYGGPGGGSGGESEYLEVSIPVTAAEVLTIGVGSATAGLHAPGVGGSGVSIQAGGNGGGSSGVANGGTILAEAAGGGGGGGQTPQANGGNGGNASSGAGASGTAGGSTSSCTSGGLGVGATTSTDGTGGAAGTSGGGYAGTAGVAGSSGVGGLGGAWGGSGSLAGGGGGGGGGGYKGGGGGGGGALNSGLTSASAGGGGGAGASHVDASCTLLANGTGNYTPQVILTWSLGATPYAPVLDFPAYGTNEELSSVGPTFGFNYEPGSGSGPLSGWAFQQQQSTASTPSYWNAAAGTFGSTIVWNSVGYLTNLGGGEWSYQFPTGKFSDSASYSWSVACQEATFSLQGPFASSFVVTSYPGPSCAITAPSTLVVTNVSPPLTWTFTGSSGSTLVNTYAYLYTAAIAAGVGFVPGVTPGWLATQTFTSALTATMPGAPLINGNAYTICIRVFDSASHYSSWQTYTFTISVPSPPAPILTVSAQNDPVTGAPYVLCLGALPNLNLLSGLDSSFEGGLGNWGLGGYVNNCTVTASTAQALAGSYSMALTCVSGSSPGYMYVEGTATPPVYPVAPGQQMVAFASWRAAATPRSCCVYITFWGPTGAYVTNTQGAYVTDSTTGWTQAQVTAVAPPGVAYMSIAAFVQLPATSEVHYVDCAGLYMGTTPPTWALGGVIDSTQLMEFQWSDDGVTWADLRYGGAQDIFADQSGASDYEAQPGVPRYYQARTIGGIYGIASPYCPAQLVTVSTNKRWYLLDPTNPASAVGFDLSADLVLTYHEQATRYYPLGRPRGVKASDGTKGRDGKVQARTFNVIAHGALLALIDGTTLYGVWTQPPGTLLLQMPVGGLYISLEGDRSDNLLLTTAAPGLNWAPGPLWDTSFTFVEAMRP